jgi:GNAT superfamily N-acetyltransferase
MAVTKAGAPVVRDYDPADEHAVLALLSSAFGRWPTRLDGVDPLEFFRWKTARCPFGASRSLVAESEGELIGFAAQLPWRMRVADRTLTTSRGTDLAVDPAHQGRGVAQQLMRAAAATHPPEIALVWNNPNELSRGSVMKVGRRRLVAVRRFMRAHEAPGRMAARLLARGARTPQTLEISAPAASEVLSDDAFLATLLEALPRDAQRLTTERSPEYLRWRYAFDVYRAVRVGSSAADGGIAIFRTHRSGSVWLAYVCELLAPRPRIARALLRAVGAAGALDCACANFGSAAQALCAGAPLRAGFIELTVRAVHEDLPVAPTRSSSWALSLGDLELL